MKETALTGVHRKLGARIVPFAGYEMPLEYSGVKDEHINVRNAVGIFDVSHMGEFWVKGPRAASFIQRVTSNDVNKLAPGLVQYTCFPNGRGGIVDDLLVYQFTNEKFMLVVNAANKEKDWQWLVEQNNNEAELQDSSDEISQMAIQGPEAINVLKKFTSADLAGMRHYSFLVENFAGMDEVIISSTGYTGSPGFELYCYNSQAVTIWDKIMEGGREFGIKPIGLAARDTLRLEAGYCLYGNDIDDSTSPIEAGLGWITKFTDNNDFIDRQRLEHQKKQGTTRVLAGFRMIDKAIPRQHYEITNSNGQRIGEVTSGTMSPMLNAGIGMGYVLPDYASVGKTIFIKVRNKELKAEVVKLPFYK